MSMINFLKDIEDLYNVIVQPIDNIYKNTALESYRKKYNLKSNELIRDFYILNMGKKEWCCIYYRGDIKLSSKEHNKKRRYNK